MLLEETGVPGENHRSLRVKLEDRKHISEISEKLWDQLGFEPTLSATATEGLTTKPRRSLVVPE